MIEIFLLSAICGVLTTLNIIYLRDSDKAIFFFILLSLFLFFGWFGLLKLFALEANIIKNDLKVVNLMSSIYGSFAISPWITLLMTILFFLYSFMSLFLTNVYFKFRTPSSENFYNAYNLQPLLILILLGSFWAIKDNIILVIESNISMYSSIADGFENYSLHVFLNKFFIFVFICAIAVQTEKRFTLWSLAIAFKISQIDLTTSRLVFSL